MFKNFDFEQVHPSKKAAFADGALTATLIVSTVAWMWTERQTAKAWIDGWTSRDNAESDNTQTLEK